MSLFEISAVSVIQKYGYVCDIKKGVSELNKTRTPTSTCLVTIIYR